MKPIVRALCLGAILLACSGCAHDVGGSKDMHAANADAEPTSCDAAVRERVYRNSYLRARRIGHPACAD